LLLCCFTLSRNSCRHKEARSSTAPFLGLSLQDPDDFSKLITAREATHLASVPVRVSHWHYLFIYSRPFFFSDARAGSEQGRRNKLAGVFRPISRRVLPPGIGIRRAPRSLNLLRDYSPHTPFSRRNFFVRLSPKLLGNQYSLPRIPSRRLSVPKVNLSPPPLF